jgi:hypothetical protein
MSIRFSDAACIIMQEEIAQNAEKELGRRPGGDSKLEEERDNAMPDIPTLLVWLILLCITVFFENLHAPVLLWHCLSKRCIVPYLFRLYF